MKTATALAAGILVTSCTFSAVADDLASLGMTRPQFWRTAKASLPGLKVPLFRCGRPIVLMHCRERLGDRLEVEVTETMISTELAEEFTFGAPGLVYSAGISYRYPHEPAEFATFVGYCASFLVAAGRVPDAAEGVRFFTRQLEKAVASIDDGFGMSIDGAEPLVFVVEVMQDYNLICRVSAQ